MSYVHLFFIANIHGFSIVPQTQPLIEKIALRSARSPSTGFGTRSVRIDGTRCQRRLSGGGRWEKSREKSRKSRGKSWDMCDQWESVEYNIGHVRRIPEVQHQIEQLKTWKLWRIHHLQHPETGTLFHLFGDLYITRKSRQNFLPPEWFYHLGAHSMRKHSTETSSGYINLHNMRKITGVFLLPDLSEFLVGFCHPGAGMM